MLPLGISIASAAQQQDLQARTGSHPPRCGHLAGVLGQALVFAAAGRLQAEALSQQLQAQVLDRWQKQRTQPGSRQQGVLQPESTVSYARDAVMSAAEQLVRQLHDALRAVTFDRLRIAGLTRVWATLLGTLTRAQCDRCTLRACACLGASYGSKQQLKWPALHQKGLQCSHKLAGLRAECTVLMLRCDTQGRQHCDAAPAGGPAAATSAAPQQHGQPCCWQADATGTPMSAQPAT